VSTGQQSVDQQHDLIAAAGVVPDRVFTDTASGRAGSNRPGWAECMGWLREGDHLVVVAVDRLGRSVREVATALHELTSRGVHLRSPREGVDTSTPTGRAVTSIMATIAELELELGKERRAASREARIARGLAATKPMKLGPTGPALKLPARQGRRGPALQRDRFAFDAIHGWLDAGQPRSVRSLESGCGHRLSRLLGPSGTGCGRPVVRLGSKEIGPRDWEGSPAETYL
jgi:hypothetical protein